MILNANAPIQVQLDPIQVAQQVFPAIVNSINALIQEERSRIDFLTIEQTAKLLQISVPTLNKWTKEGKFVKYCVEGTSLFYYKRAEIESSIKAVLFKKTL